MGRNKIIERIIKYLQNIDIFGSPVNLTINHSRKSNTIFGGCLTIISIIGIIVYAIYNAEDFYLKLNPSVSRTTYSKTQAPSIMINKTTFPIAFNLWMGDITSSGLKFNGWYINSNVSTELTFKKCTKDDFPLINKTNFDEILGNSSLCIDNLNYELFNNFENDNNNGLIEIEVRGCNRKTKADCDLIDQYINNNYISIMMTNVGIHLDDLKNPLDYFIESLYIMPAQGYLKQLNMKIKKETLITDDGWFIKNLKEQHALSLDMFYFDFSLGEQENGNQVNYNFLRSLKDKTEDINFNDTGNYSDYRDKNKEILFILDIIPSNNEEIIKRIYLKLHNAVADVGGILSIILTIMPFLTFFLVLQKLKKQFLIHYIFMIFQMNLMIQTKSKP